MGLYAYFDESGKFHDGSGFICLCGYLGSEKDWDPFCERWARLLLKHRFDYIHFTQFESQCRNKGWDNIKTQAVLTEFIEVIREASLVGFAVGIDGRYFNHRFEIAGRPNVDPARFAVHRIVRELREACVQWNAALSPRISINFDEDESYSVKCYQLISRLRKMKPEVKEMIVSIGFADDRFFTALQAADVLAGLTNRYWRDKLDQESPEPPEMLRLLVEPKDGGSFMWEKDELWSKKKIDENWDQLLRAQF